LFSRMFETAIVAAAKIKNHNCFSIFFLLLLLVKK
jgi:hypothetical protein